MTKYMAYLLGFFWADGYICGSSFASELKRSDAIFIEEVFQLGNIQYSIYDRDRYGRQPQRTITVKDSTLIKELVHIGLISHRNKSSELDHIPLELLRYYYLGFTDGDGNFYCNQERGLNQCTYSGCYEQDWNYLSDYLSSINISSTVKRTMTYKQSSSILRFTGRERINKFYNHIYPHEYELGLKRKYLIAKAISENKYINLKDILD